MSQAIKRGQYIRKSVHTVDEILAIVGSGLVDAGDHTYNTDSDRLYLFQEKGVCCVHCGIEGVFFAKEKDWKTDHEKYHFNLYALNANNDPVLMTKDHIKPRSKGGPDKLENYQTMCARCNKIKSDIYVDTNE